MTLPPTGISHVSGLLEAPALNFQRDPGAGLWVGWSAGPVPSDVRLRHPKGCYREPREGDVGQFECTTVGRYPTRGYPTWDRGQAPRRYSVIRRAGDIE